MQCYSERSRAQQSYCEKLDKILFPGGSGGKAAGLQEASVAPAELVGGLGLAAL